MNKADAPDSPRTCVASLCVVRLSRLIYHQLFSPPKCLGTRTQSSHTRSSSTPAHGGFNGVIFNNSGSLYLFHSLVLFFQRYPKVVVNSC